MLIKIDDPILEVRSYPTTYATLITKVDSEEQADAVVRLLKWLQTWVGLKDLLEMDRNLVILPVLRQLVAHHLLFVPPSGQGDWSRWIHNHIHDYERFLDSTPSHAVSAEGRSYATNGGSSIFSTKEDALTHYICQKVSWGSYVILECEDHGI